MHVFDFKDTALQWYKSNPVCLSGKNSESKLFEMLYNAYCRMVNNGRDFQDTVQECTYTEDCSEMFTWYKDTYTKLGLKKGTQGQKRFVTGNEEEYTFNLLYSDDRQFQAYLLTDTPQSGSQDLLCFILHSAVAFLVSPKELDEVLQKLGFHPLHVRNVHHLAIYTVLTASQDDAYRIPEGYNPFDEVRALYFRACDILESGEHWSSDTFSFSDYLTKEIRQILFLNKELSYGNFDAIVRNNVSGLNRRHSLILDDFHKLSAVYTTIFEDYPEENQRHSFYQFVNRFCKPISPKKFRENMGSMIDNNQKHPTRQILILLWLFDYCFSFIDGIELSDDTFEKIQKKLRKYNSNWAADAKKHRTKLLFDAYGFIHSNDGRKGPRQGSCQFGGSDFFADLNNKLMLRYGWGRLNPRLPFDHYILSLCSVNIGADERFAGSSVLKIELPLQSYTDTCTGKYIAPYPLLVVMDVLEQVKAVIEEESGKLSKQKAKDISPFPLDCRIYEQI